MPRNLFKGIFDSDITRVISIENFLFCIGFSFVLGLVISLCYIYRTRYTKSFVVTLALLPAAICLVIMMVNGNVGTGVAVAGAFSLVRFRSVPGTAKEICTIFVAMGAGLACGMGYLGFGALFTFCMCFMYVIYNTFSFGTKTTLCRYKTLNVTIPEDLDYTGIFDDIFKEHTLSSELVRVKSTNMGSMFRLTYNLVMRDITTEKQMIDKLRTRNGNLEITVSVQDTNVSEL